jgi:hypothetical protein
VAKKSGRWEIFLSGGSNLHIGETDPYLKRWGRVGGKKFLQRYFTMEGIVLPLWHKNFTI